MAELKTVSLKKIKAEGRHRKDYGDIAKLAASIKEIGLLHPVVLMRGNRLVVGARRLKAFALLGHKTIPALVARDFDEAHRLVAETDENVCRKDYTLREAVALARALRPAEKAAADERKKAGIGAGGVGGRGKKKPPGKFPGGFEKRARDQVASAVGLSGRTLEKAEAVIAAEEEDKERFGELADEMERTGKVDPAFRTLSQLRDAENIPGTPSIEGKFRTIVIDPPWDYGGQNVAGRAIPQYAVMDEQQLMDLPVPEWVEEPCHLYLWATNAFLFTAFKLLEAWGFDYKACLTWVKPRIGLGLYFRNNTEHVLFATRGKAPTRANDIPTAFQANTHGHSVKPEEFFKIVERASWPPYLEAFARREREGWNVWGAGL